MIKKILVNVEATPSCPASCSMCPRSVIKDYGFITLETMDKIVSQIDPSYVWELDLAGRGEPTIHPEFHELLKMMRKSGVLTDVTTTAVTFNQRNIDACVDNVDVIRLSVSSIRKEIFDKVHVGLNHEKIWRNIAALAEAAADKVIVHLTGGPVIYSTLAETVAHLRQLGFKRIYLFPLWNRGGDINAKLEGEYRKKLVSELNLNLSESEYKTGMGKVKFMLNALMGTWVNSNFCAVGDGSLSISYKGDILGCFQDFGHVSNIGHVENDRLKEIVKSRVKLLGNMDICKGCNSRKAVLKLPMFLSR
ncbi:radical SAM protein [Pseudomonas sp. CVAP|uniref:radical SAM protein n=1 Tax=Pseudomonas sp. CVAP\|nr:radical SAM protein [Pseudomonas sp. CVAP\